MGQLRGSVGTARKKDSQCEIKTSLKKEILHLQEELQDQFVMRNALEKELSRRPYFSHGTSQKTIPKEAEQLIVETAVLELEVVFLEKYLLTLYRNKFNEHPSHSPTEDERKLTSVAHGKVSPPIHGHQGTLERESFFSHSCRHPPRLTRGSIGSPLKEEEEDIWAPKYLPDIGIQRSQSSLSQRSSHPNRTSHPENSFARAVGYHSLPLFMLERASCSTSKAISLADHLGTSITDNVLATPNWLSEEMVKSMSAIYCELAEPPLTNYYHLSSPNSPSSYIVDQYPSGDLGDTRSSHHCRYSSFNSHYGNPFHIESSREFSGPYGTMLKVQLISSDAERLKSIEYMLRKYRSIVHQLRRVEPSKLKHEEKLAFWINVHNALVMHSFLAHGIPQNKLKRMPLLLKAAYDIGGHTISVDTIQNSILQCRLLSPGKWLRILFPSKQRFKVDSLPKEYEIDHPEPLSHFALCLGSRSDPAVRVFRSDKVFQELKVAKEEYLQSNFRLCKKRILLPKLVDTYAKSSGLSAADLLMILKHCLPDFCVSSFRQFHKRSWKSFEWTPQNSDFQYLFSSELA
ncbi:uncharacterized protein LOC115737257 [Rhodamnia argentea]|uniref:Uncharacterized protein LOC115737257 n=1 Tax=Rhodamnia argentea TaxID=178133 RepID=A0A8B8NSJ7_9MYRT|nr:uncharacterized protein LOC115737257 [Rhodamnia argentea]XP_048134895.1 uncharacterized protein LOC115737257 [Rhodamnia argentea]